MEKHENGNLKKMAKLYCDEIENSPFYETFYKQLQSTSILEDVTIDNFTDTLTSTIKRTGLETKLRNDILYWTKERCFAQLGAKCWIEKEPHDYLRRAQMHWEKRLYKSLNSMCIELGISLSVFRVASDRDEILEKWNLLSTYNLDLAQYRPVYAPKDFLEVLLNVENTNLKISTANKSGDFSKISLKVNSLQELKSFFGRLTTNEPLMATFLPSTPVYCSLEQKRIALGKKLLKFNHASVTQEFLKELAPHSLRSKLWAQVLGSQIYPRHQEYFKNLKSLVAQYDMLVDKLIFKDIQLTVCNDDQYFVFEDILYQVMLCFSRDLAVADVFYGNSSNPIVGTLKGKSNLINNSVVYPPNGVIPFHGFSMYAAPLCYVFSDPVQLYFSMRSLYLRYWSRLHEVNSHPQGILSLCVLFQQLFEYHEPQLCSHFYSVNIQPIKIVFKWLMRCFSGHLPPTQLLNLWDLIIGYDSLHVIPLLAVTILSFRKTNLLEVDTMHNVEAVLADLSSIQIIPLLQIVLAST